MKRPHKIIGKTLLVGTLSTVLGWYAVAAMSDPTGSWLDLSSASGSALLAQLNLNNDKPPYLRDRGYKQEGKGKPMEKGEFARFEEKPAATEETKQPAYRYIPGAKPPYQINP